jgi:Glycosyl transferase family 90
MPRRRIGLWVFSCLLGILLSIQGLLLVRQWSERASFASTESFEPWLQNDVATPRFPHWGAASSIDVERDVMDFVSAALDTYVSTIPPHQSKTRSRYPEILYTLNRSGLAVVDLWRKRHWRRAVKERVIPVEAIMVQAAALLLQDSSSYPTLKTLLLEDNATIPFLVWYGDYRDCPSNGNYWENGMLRPIRVPLMTMCARLDCPYAIPIPSYQSIQTANAASSFNSSHFHIPWNSKQPKLVWRGSLSDANHGNWTMSARFRIVRQALHRPDLFDVGFTQIPPQHRLPIDQTLLMKPALVPMERFMEYQAILDMDGNSWSSRFGTLLCYNSVVLKVTPAFVDSFYYQLRPHVHYIPVNSSGNSGTWLEALTRKMLDPGQAAQVGQIVDQANAWCRNYFTTENLAREYLDIWQTYATWIQRGSRPEWPARVAHRLQQDRLQLRKLA